MVLTLAYPTAGSVHTHNSVDTVAGGGGDCGGGGDGRGDVCASALQHVWRWLFFFFLFFCMWRCFVLVGGQGWWIGVVVSEPSELIDRCTHGCNPNLLAQAYEQRFLAELDFSLTTTEVVGKCQHATEVIALSLFSDPCLLAGRAQPCFRFYVFVAPLHPPV